MLKLTPKAHAYMDHAVRQVFGGSGIKGADLYDEGDNPFAYVIEIPLENDERLVMRKCNELFAYNKLSRRLQRLIVDL